MFFLKERTTTKKKVRTAVVVSYVKMIEFDHSFPEKMKTVIY